MKRKFYALKKRFNYKNKNAKVNISTIDKIEGIANVLM